MSKLLWPLRPLSASSSKIGSIRTMSNLESVNLSTEDPRRAPTGVHSASKSIKTSQVVEVAIELEFGLVEPLHTLRGWMLMISLTRKISESNSLYLSATSIICL